MPAEAGVYGWWFRTLPAVIDTTHCAKRGELTLLYTGISPSRPPVNGRPPSRQDLRKRIRNHSRGNASGSTLRMSLGCLLSDRLGIELRRYGGGHRRQFGSGEAVLSEWMAENALVSWITDPEPWVAEGEVIAYLDLPLNLQGNAFYAGLTAVRTHAVRRANELPVLVR